MRVRVYDAKGGNEVTLLDFWEDHIQAIRENGLSITVNGKEDNITIPVGKPDEFNETFETVFIFTKSMGLRHMLEAIKHLLDENTKVVCLLNGLGHANTISKYVPKKISSWEQRYGQEDWTLQGKRTLWVKVP